MKNSSAITLKGRDLVCISTVEWDFLRQNQHDVCARLAQNGVRVLYIENMGIRAPVMKDAWRVAHRLRNWSSEFLSRSVRQVADNLYVYSPLSLPPFGARWQRQLNRKVFLPMAQRAARRIGMRDPLILSYLPTDAAIDLINLLRSPQSVVAYYRVDNLALLAPHARKLQEAEERLCRMSDLVLATCAELAEPVARCNSNIFVIPNGVNLEAFPVEDTAAPNASGDNAFSPIQRADDFPEDRPVIGYVGGLTRHVNFELLTAMARARPQWSWVFVGPEQHPINGLRNLPNVYLTGQRPHQDLVNYIRRFDVCIIPYRLSSFTETVVPTKLNEYLAVGKPVVSTNLPFVSRFNERHGVLLTTDEQPESFLSALEQALKLKNDPQTVARRRNVAKLNDWGTQTEIIIRLMEIELRKKAVANIATGESTGVKRDSAHMKLLRPVKNLGRRVVE